MLVVSKLPLTLSYTWHPLGSSIVLFMGTVSLFFSQRAYGKKRDSSAWEVPVILHAIFNWVAVAGLARGQYAIFNAKEEQGKAHLTTAHAYMGIATMVLFFFNLIGGAAVKISPKSYAESVKKHRLFGYIAYGCIVASHASSLYKGCVNICVRRDVLRN